VKRLGIISAPKGDDHRSPFVDEVTQRLAERAVTVDVIVPDERLLDLGHIEIERDLYVIKSGTDLALAYAGLLHDAGARMVNSFHVTSRIRDKLLASRTLLAAGIPSPESYVATSAAAFAPVLEGGPVVVKPIRGSRGAGVTIVERPQGLDAIPSDGLFFAQRYHAPDGLDNKIYVVGGRAFGVRRRWPARTYEEKLGEPFDVTGEFADLAEACAAAFGTDLFGFDIVQSGGQSYVVDVNAFPGFKGVPEAGELVADYLYRALAP
jgi:ribosomal protein S6--L-glutamate ligase